MKKKWIICGVTAGALALAGGGILLARGMSREKVPVIAVQEISGSFWNGRNSLSGTVVSDVSQNIYLQQNETVKEIYVQEGAQVREGDKLVSYDMTMVSLELEMKKLDIQGIDLKTQKAQRELEKLKASKPSAGGGDGSGGGEYADPGGEFVDPGIGEDPGESEDPGGEEKPPQVVAVAADCLDETSAPYAGEGTEAEPYRFLCRENGLVKGSFLKKMAQEGCYFLIEVREGDSSIGALRKVWGQKIADGAEDIGEETAYLLKLAEDEAEPEAPAVTVYESLTGAEGEAPYKGDGTAQHPFTWAVKKDGIVLGSFYNARKAAGGCFRIEIREGDQPDGAVIMAWELDAKELAEQTFSDTDVYYVSLEIREESADPGNQGETPEPPGPQEPSGSQDPPENQGQQGGTAEQEQSGGSEGGGQGNTAPQASNSRGSGRYQSEAPSGNVRILSAQIVRLADQELVSDVMAAGDGMTAAELSSAIAEKEKEIKDYALTKREAQLELRQIERNLENQTIYSALNGVVKSVKDPEHTDGEPLIQVVGSEGFYVRGTVSENMLDDLVPGMRLEGFSYENGVNFTAEVKEISPYPMEGDYGGMNASMYPFIARIDDASGLSNYNYVELSPAEQEGETSGGGIYISRPFVRIEDGEYYVMREDQSGRLKKQTIQVSGMLYGEYYKVTSGVGQEDRIAFPYGKNVREGARTEDGSLEQLYQ